MPTTAEKTEALKPPRYRCVSESVPFARAYTPLRIEDSAGREAWVEVDEDGVRFHLIDADPDFDQTAASDEAIYSAQWDAYDRAQEASLR